MLKRVFIGLLFTAATGLASADNNGHMVSYKVTITNITPGQTFTPQLVVTHPHKVKLFTLGDAASAELEVMAEGGDTGPLTTSLADQAYDTKTIPGLLGPGESASITVKSRSRKAYISVAAMLIPTNDTFVALNRVRLPKWGSITKMVPAYDAGTEFNDQNCLNIPGPRCQGEGYSIEVSDGDEGFVHIGNGFHELGGYDATGGEILTPKVYDWRNSVAKITVKRLH